MKKETEEAFLYSTFIEFNKCWRSGTKARVIMETFNGQAFINFSAFLGHPDDTHFHPRQSRWNPPKKPRKKSEKKIKRDNDRAARFQENKRKEGKVLNSEPVENPGPPSATSGFEFSFASPTKEDLSSLSTSTGTTNQVKRDSIMDVQFTQNCEDSETELEEHIEEDFEFETLETLRAKRNQIQDSKGSFPRDDLEYLIPTSGRLPLSGLGGSQRNLDSRTYNIIKDEEFTKDEIVINN